MAKQINTLPVGALVKDANTRYNGTPIIFRVIDKNHSGYPANSVTLMTDRIISLKAADAIEPSSSDGNRRSYGNNRYIYSNIRQWLNSTAASNWFTKKHSQDQKPDNEHVWDNKNEYDNEAGFLHNFSSEMRNALLNTSSTVARSNTDGGGVESFSDKIFLASCTEMGLSGDQTCGVHFNHFNSNESRKAKPTSQCVSNSEYTNSSFNANAPWYYWLRDAYTSHSYYVCYVYSNGTLSSFNAYNGNEGVRPLCNLGSSILVSDNPDSDGAYTIVWNRPPQKPTSITVPDAVRGGHNATISWGSSTDPDSNLAGYRLERKVNNGNYTQIYQGINRTFTDSITFGWQSVRYRVRAYDSAGATSSYETSPQKTVINNKPPTISGNNENLGEKLGTFTKSYTVTDVDAGQTLTVVEKINNKTIRTFTATSGQSNTISLTQAEWTKLLNGSHELKVIASDNSGGTTERVYSFTKNETEIELTLTQPLAADDMVTKAIVNITSQIPLGATLEVYVCNNGHDASPTWEDVTNIVRSGGKIFFANKTKTAVNWGFNFKIKINRNNATGDLFIAGIGGNFE